MKYCIVTQIYNELHRIHDWISYHKKIGFDSIYSMHTGDLVTCDDWQADNCLVLSHKYQKPVKGHNWTHDVVNTITGLTWPCNNDIENEFTMLYSNENLIKIYHFRDYPNSNNFNDEYDLQDDTIKKIMQ
jgi:hypothetical protein